MSTAANKHSEGYGRRDPETGMVHGLIRHPDGRPPTPSGCRWCGAPQHGHFRRFLPRRGFHAWTAPMQKQILARMKARRRARTTAGRPV
jgi:hypothetical protein